MSAPISALVGEIENFNGERNPYESMLNLEVMCYSDGTETPEESAGKIWKWLEEQGLVKAL